MTKLRLYNSLTRRLEAFEPREKGKVGVYHCGPTVYRRQHIGNMRRYLFADFLRRSLEYFGYEVREVMNITDVGHLTQDEIDAGEDKLELAARERKMTPLDIAEEQIGFFYEDQKQLNIMPAHIYPRATLHIQPMQDLIKTLIDKGHAYEAPSGVYFDVQSFPDYGRLSGNNLDNIESGKRVEINTDKKHPADFALWKTGDSDHLQQWDSPWGKGYPGWHIECSAMSLDYLGSKIDIHTGGEDNRFPHHENEIAQSEGATGEKFVNIWMHNAHLQLAGVKLAKREGEQITLDTLTEKGYSPLAFRLLVFGAHYRQKMEFSWEALDGASENLAALKQLVRRLREWPASTPSPSEGEEDKDMVRRFWDALADDLNTPKALAVLLSYVRAANTVLGGESVSEDEVREMWATLKALDKVVGVISPLLAEIEAETIPREVKELADKREAARAGDDYKRADRLRRQIEGLGYRIEDTDGGQRIIRE